MAKGKFNLGAKTNTSTTTLSEKANILEIKKDFDFRPIPVEKIIPNPSNFYEVNGIRELADNIKEFGLLQNLEVLEVEIEGEKMYRIITGHRRFEAIKLLISEEEKSFDMIPCKVEKDLTDIEEQLRLIKSNSDTRELSQEDKRKQVEELKRLYSIKNKLEGIKVSKTELKESIASDTGLSAKQVERYNTINEKLIPDLQQYFDNGKIAFNDAIKFARLDEEMQLAILEMLQVKDKITDEEVEVIKCENKKLKEEKEITEKELAKKEKELASKEKEIITLENEKSELISEQQNNEIEKEVAEEERAKLEAKIREEIAQLTEEEVLKLKNELEVANTKVKELANKEKALAQNLKSTEDKLNEKTQEIQELKDLEESKEETKPAITQEEIEKRLDEERFKNEKTNIIASIKKLGDLAKKFATLDVADQTLVEIERELKSFEKKTRKLPNEEINEKTEE